MMKKSLIALAIASAVSAPAFAATSNVDIYGVLNLSMNFVDQDTTGLPNSYPSITSNASRIGFKGAEDLGGGLAAIWQIESGFNADEQSGSLASRNTYIGLKGGFGTVLMGNHDTPMKLLGRMVDGFGDSLADTRNILGAVATGKNAFDLRTKNTVAYVSPAFSGLTVTAAYVSDWNATGDATAPAALTPNPNALDYQTTNAYSINGIYNNGPLMLGAAYEMHNGLGSGTAGVGTNSDMWRIVGGFDVAGFKLAALYEQIGGDVAASNRDAYGVMGSYAIGAWTLKANYLNASESDGVYLVPGGGGATVIGNDGADQWTVGADYSLSKRTVVYGFYAATNNDTYGGYGLGAGAGASDQTFGNKGSGPSTLSLGVKHAF